MGLKQTCMARAMQVLAMATRCGRQQPLQLAMAARSSRQPPAQQLPHQSSRHELDELFAAVHRLGGDLQQPRKQVPLAAQVLKHRLVK